MPRKSNDLVENAALNLQSFFIGVWGFARHNWVKVVVLAASATQTATLFSYIAPAWARIWLPTLAVLLLEGGFLWWTWREQISDPIEKNDVMVNIQEQICNGVAWLTLVLSALTMTAGVFVEVAQSQLNTILRPNPGLTNFLGWAAVVGVFLAGVVQLWADWAWKRSDPKLKMEREHRAGTRELIRRRRSSELRAENDVLQHESSTLEKLYGRHSRLIGRRRARQEFRNKNADVFGQRRRPVRAKRKARRTKK